MKEHTTTTNNHDDVDMNTIDGDVDVDVDVDVNVNVDNNIDINLDKLDLDNDNNNDVDGESIMTDAKTVLPDNNNNAKTNTSILPEQILTTVQKVQTNVNINDMTMTTTKTVKHSWSQPGAQNVYQVRGESYMNDARKRKYDSEEQIFQTRGVDFFLTKDFGPTNIGRCNSLLGGKLREKPTFIVNFRFPWGVLVFYHEIPTRYLPLLRQKYVPTSKNSTSSSTLASSTSTSLEDFITLDEFLQKHNTPHDKAMYNFIMGDDTYRNSKLKLIPKVVEGNIIVRKLVKGKPVIMGKKLPISYMYEPENVKDGNWNAEYWECDLDIGSSSATAKKIVGVCKKYMTSLTVDMGFVVEGSEPDELPERILTSTRIHHFDTKLSPTLRMS